MATIKFYGNRFDGANEVQDLINHSSGSGLGFFATAGFGYPVPVDETQGSTFKVLPNIPQTLRSNRKTRLGLVPSGILGRGFEIRAHAR